LYLSLERGLDFLLAAFVLSDPDMVQYIDNIGKAKSNGARLADKTFYQSG
jgi:hypothetical protein